MKDKKIYSYIAIDKKGKRFKGNYEASNENEVIDYLYAQGWTPISVDETLGIFSLERLNEINIGGIPLKDKVFFMKQASVMINAGLSITKTLEILSSQVENPRFRKILRECVEKVASGISLSTAFSDYPDAFDSITLSLIKAGEESGNLDKIFKKLSREFESRHALASKIKSALVYPAAVTLVMTLVMIFLLIFVIPKLEATYAELGATLPTITKIVVAFSRFLLSPFGIATIILGTIGLILGGKFFLSNPSGKRLWHKTQLKLPIIGKLLLKIQAANFARVFELLISSGVPILRALELTEQSMTNVLFKEELKFIREQVQKGESLAAPFLSPTSNFPSIVGYMINVGQETGRLDVVLKKLVKYYDVEIKETTDGLTSALEPLLLIVMGLAVGVLVVAIFLPLTQIVTKIE